MNFKRPRQKDDKHLDFIRSLPCVCCGNDIETEAAHLRAAAPQYGKRYTGKSEKPSDKWTLPLCGRCHRQQHDIGEIQFWEANRINPFILAMSLFASSGEHQVATEIISYQRGSEAA